MIQEQLNREIAAFAAAIDELYGHYLDSIIGFQKIYQSMVDGQEQTKRLVPPDTDLDAADMFIGCGDPVTHHTSFNIERPKLTTRAAMHVAGKTAFELLSFSSCSFMPSGKHVIAPISLLRLG